MTAPEKPSRYAYYVLGVLTFANIMNYADRFVMSAVLPLIAKDWGINETTQGYLSTVFTVGFMLAAPFVAALGDRQSRTRIVSICVFVWSLATVGAGLAPSVEWMLAFRVVIGVGEAGLLVVGPTLVADSFPRSIRSRALSVFYLGTPVGGALGFALGGVLGKAFTWRHPLVVAGVVGLLPTVLLWLMREPARGAYDAADPHLAAHGKGGSLRDYLMLTRNRTFLFVVLALAAAMFGGTPLMHFLPTYMTSHRGIPLDVAGIQVGLIAAFAGTFGTLAFGWMADRLYARTRRAHVILAATAYAVAIPCILAGLLAPQRVVYLAGLGVAVLLIFGALTTLNTLVANVTRPKSRGMAFSALIFCMHLFGDSFSPPFYGGLIGSYGLKDGFLLMTIPFVVSVAACLVALGTVVRDLDHATGETNSETADEHR